MKRHRYQTKGAAKSLPSSSKGFYNRNLSALPYGNTAKAEDIKYLGRGQEVENLARQAVKKDKGLNVHTQEGRDDLTNPLAYAPFSGEALDLMSVGHHLREGNYGDAAMYGAGFALPFLPGAAVKRFASPAINKLKSTVKPYVDNAQGAISFYGDQIANRINRNILDPIGKTVKPYASAYIDHSSGIMHGAKELMSPDSRPFTEIFPITKTQRELVEGKQNAAFQEGIDFVDNWVYETDRKGLPGYTGRTMRGPVARRIKNIGGKPTPISLRPDLPNSNPDWYDDDFNPFNFYTDRLVNSRRKFLKNSNLDDLDKEYLATNRHRVGGFNSMGSGESVTLRNRGLYYTPPQEIAEIGVHEKGHTFQKMMGKDAPYGWSEKISERSLDHGNYGIPNLTTELGEQIGSEMIEPVLGKRTWSASPNELHSELMSSRFKLAQEWKKDYGTSMQESIENLQNPRQEDLEWLLDDIDNSNHFWKEPSWWDYTNKREILKKLPSVAAITGTGAALRSTRDSNEEMYKHGGAVKYQKKGTVGGLLQFTPASEPLIPDNPDWNPANWKRNISNMSTASGYSLTPKDFARKALTSQIPKIYGASGQSERNAWRQYLGQPQTGENRFEPSPYKEGAYQLRNYENEFPEDLSMYSDEDIKSMGHFSNVNLKHGITNPLKPFSDITFGRHTVNKVPEKDGGYYLEYSDRWDLDPERIVKNQLGIKKDYNKDKSGREFVDNKFTKLIDKAGNKFEETMFNPFDAYGRVYYDKSGKKITGKPIEFQGNNRATPSVEYQTKGTVESRARDGFRDGGETDPPVKYISDLEEFKVREQAYNDSLDWYNKGQGNKKWIENLFKKAKADIDERNANKWFWQDEEKVELKTTPFNSADFVWDPGHGPGKFEPIFDLDISYISNRDADDKYTNSYIGPPSYSVGALLYKKPTQQVEYKPEKISEVKPQKEESKQKVITEEFSKTPEIKPTITKVVKDSKGNVISTEKSISQKEAKKRFDPETKTWKKYQDGGETDPPVKYISDPEEFKRREQSYNDSLQLHNYAEEFFGGSYSDVNLDRDKELAAKYQLNERVGRLAAYNGQNPALYKDRIYGDKIVKGFEFKRPTQPVTQGYKAKATGNFNNPDTRPAYRIMMPSGQSMMKEDFINRYDEPTWKRAIGDDSVKYPKKMKSGGYVDPPSRKPEVIFDPEEFKVREQAYNDSLTAYLESVDTFESLGPLQIPMASGTIPRFEDIPRHASTSSHRRHPEIYIPGQTTYDVYTGEKARTEGYSRHFPSGNVIAPQISLGGGASGPTPGSGASMGYDFYPKPKQPVAFRKKPAFSPNRISPRWSDDLAGYFRGGPDLKGAKLETVNTKLQPIQSNWRPKSVGYTSNTAAEYPMIQRGGGTGRVPKGAYWVPGRGYKYTND